MLSGKKSTAVLAGVLIGLLSTVVIGNLQSSRPNVVMIVVDSLRADALSRAPGSANTAAMHSLGAEGVTFANAFSHSPSTLPAHVALASGRLPYETGVLSSGQPLNGSVPLLAEWLRENGYQTLAALSHASLRPQRRGEGLDRGFQDVDLGTRVAERADSVVRRVGELLERVENGRSFFLLAHFTDTVGPYAGLESEKREARILLDDRELAKVTTSEPSRWEQRAVLTPGDHVLELTSEAGIRVRDFRVDHRGRALPYELRAGDFDGASQRILVVIVNTTDAPIEVRLGAWLMDAPSLAELRARYRREVETVDRAVGQIVQQLKRRGLYENTVLVLTGAHGESLGEHGHVGRDLGLFDEILQVPLIVRLPQHMSEQRAQLLQGSYGIARHVDVVPTLLELLHLPAWGELSGRSLLQEAARTHLALAWPVGTSRASLALRDHHYKLVLDPEQAGDSEGFRMFRLSSDPLEMDDVFAHQGSLRRDWQLQLRKLSGLATR